MTAYNSDSQITGFWQSCANINAGEWLLDQTATPVSRYTSLIDCFRLLRDELAAPKPNTPSPSGAKNTLWPPNAKLPSKLGQSARGAAGSIQVDGRHT